MLIKNFTILIILSFVSFTLIGQNLTKQNLILTGSGATDSDSNVGNSELKYFSAELKDKSVHVVWNMNHTEGIAGFELYKSTDGSSWDMIEFLDCNDPQEKAFEYIDEIANWGFNFYRIKSIDINGESALLRTAKVVFEYETGAEIGDFFPNPATNGLSKLNINATEGGEAQIYIHDSMGKMVRSYNKEIESGADTISIDLDGFSEGIFCTTININRETYSRKFMVIALN